MNAQEYSDRGEKYFSERNFDGAIADYTEVIKLEPDNPFAYSKRGISYIQKKELDLAIADFTEAIRLEPNKFGDFYVDRGCAYNIKGEKALAIADLEMAVKIDPQNKTYREMLEELKAGKITTNVSSSNAGLIKHIIFMIVGGVIGGIIGFTISESIRLLCLAIGVFVGIGLRPLLQGVKEFLIDGLATWGQTIKDSMAEADFFITGFFKGLFGGAVAFFIIGLFVLAWKIIKSPFVAIYQLVTGNYEVDY